MDVLNLCFGTRMRMVTMATIIVVILFITAQLLIRPQHHRARDFVAPQLPIIQSLPLRESGKGSLDLLRVKPTPQENTTPAPSIKYCTQSERRKFFRDACATLGLDAKGPSEMLKHAGRLLVDDKHRIMYAGFAKSGSSLWRMILINASGDFNGKPLKSVHGNSLMARYGIRPLATYTEQEALVRLDNYFKFLVVRHPYDRLVSTWRDKFIQPDGPFRKLGKTVARRYRQPIPDAGREVRNSASDDGSDLATFPEFLRYLSEKSPRNDHWNPYTALHPCSVHWDAIVKAETVHADSRDIFRRLNYTGVLPLMHSHQDPSQLEDHVAKPLRDFVGIESPVREFLDETYGPDLQLFGYSWDAAHQVALCGGQVKGHGYTCC